MNWCEQRLEENTHGLLEKKLIQFGFPVDKILGVGIIDGHNIWRCRIWDKPYHHLILVCSDCKLDKVQMELYKLKP